ncbi:hypothetical protein B0T18DRAFT_439023 [Schizothecium vesticola]|uniref:DUF159-domain-containing protein n=1 Tax=Schizothecium vesticola TaxID=314040 RepID=A0AA40EP35_9PEZI|nr:hypothetical protein B0T18DRAFT_439023 [Schizothecium vesticola]
MCGRYVLALTPSVIRRMLQDNDMLIDDAPPDDGPLAPRQSYNFAPTYHGIVLRAAEAPSPQDSTSSGTSNNTPFADTSTPKHQQQHCILQTMKWGLVPAWTAKNNTTKNTTTTHLKTINCRADSLAQPTGLWARLRHKRRCIVLADGFYEWLKTGPSGKTRTPYYIKRSDGLPMCFAGLWDYVPPSKNADGEVAGEGLYSYTIVTTESCEALRFLHDRMPVRWLGVAEGSFGEVGGLLRPWEEEGGLEVYKKRFVEPVEGGKGDIAGWFKAEGKSGGEEDEEEGGKDVEVEVKDEEGDVKQEMKSVDEVEEDAGVSEKGVKREAEGETKDEPPQKKMMGLASPSPVKSRPKISATRNVHKSPKKGVKGKGDGSQKITKFFGNSA